jgi:hypothetical protein
MFENICARRAAPAKGAMQRHFDDPVEKIAYLVGLVVYEPQWRCSETHLTTSQGNGHLPAHKFNTGLPQISFAPDRL